MKKTSIIIKTLLSCALVGTFITGCSDKAKSNGFGDDGILTIAYVANEPNAKNIKARETLVKDLSKSLNCEVKEVVLNSYQDVINALDKGDVDGAYMDSRTLARGLKTTHIAPIVMEAEDGDKNKATYHSLFITNVKNKDINSITDFVGHTIAFVNPESTSGNLIPTAEILRAFSDLNLKPEDIHTNGRFFKSVYFSGSQLSGLNAVIKGEVDIAPIAEQVLQKELDSNKIPDNTIKVVYTSAAIPTECFVVSEHVKPNAVMKLQDFLVKYANDDYFNSFTKIPDARFVKTSLEDFKQIIELDNLINE